MELQNRGVGCYLNNIYCGSLAYADDVVLLSPSMQGLQEMLNICSKFASKYYVSFNSQKTMCMHIRGKTKVTRQGEVYLDGIPLKWCNQFKYLGCVVADNQ